MEISYKKDGNKSFMIIKEQEVHENDYKLQMVVNNHIDGLLSLRIKMMNNQPELHYDVTSGSSLESAYARKQMSGKDLCELVKGLQKLSESLKEYLLDLNDILFGMEFIYFNRQEHKYYFCYCPEKEGDYQESLRDFFDKILEYINHDDRQAVLIAYGIQQRTLGNDFTVQDLMECARKHIRELTPEEPPKVFYENKKKPTENRTMETVVENTHGSKKHFLQKLMELLKGKHKYQDEDELTYSEKMDAEIEKSADFGIPESVDFGIKENERFGIKENAGLGIKENARFGMSEATGQMVGEMEDATMLLTSCGALKAMTLKSVDTENPMEITLNKLPCIIGKSRKSSDFYLDNPVVSRVHMRVSEEMAGYYVEDLNSTNGTYVNGVQLVPHQRKEVNAGDRITLADMDFIVE